MAKTFACFVVGKYYLFQQIHRFFGIGLLILCAGCHIDASRDADPNNNPEIRPPAAHLDSVIISPMPAYTPSFTLPTLFGDSVRLSDFRGETVLVHFWAAWCPPCLRMIPVLNALDRAEDIQVLGILTQPPASLEDLRREYDASFPILLGDGSASEALGYVYSLPTSVLVSPDGIVTHRLVGPFSVREVQALLQP